MSRSELGWLQAVVGAKVKIPPKADKAEIQGTIAKALANDKIATGSANKILLSHMPRKQIPASHKEKASLLMDIVTGKLG